MGAMNETIDTQLGRDITIGPNVVFAPGVTVENDVEFSAFAYLADCVIRRGSFVEPLNRQGANGWSMPDEKVKQPEYTDGDRLPEIGSRQK